MKRLLPRLGVVAAALLLVNVNVLAARWYTRWDVTRDRLYTLSDTTLELLQRLDGRLEVLVLLGRADPLSVSVRHMLETYRAALPTLAVRYLDPDRSPAEFLAVQQKYRILAGKADDGRIVTDAALIVTRGERHWFVTSDELVHLDEDSGRSRPALEQALSSAIANVLGNESAKLCFTVGHREPTLEDAGPEGLSELAGRLAKSNYETVSVDGSLPKSSYAECRAVVVVAPELEFEAEAARKLLGYLRSGGSALFILPPALDEAGRVRASGLEPALSAFGMSLGRNLVLETDDAQRLPRGAGESFFGKLRPHAVTRGVLHEDDKLSSKVLMIEARSVEAGSAGSVLVETSREGVVLSELALLGEPNRHIELERVLGGSRQRYALVAARELPKPAGSSAAYGPRLVLAGASNFAWNRNFRDPSLYGNRRLLENALSWVAARPTMLSVPEKAERDVGISLASESLSEVMRYVLLYMPGSAALLGAFVLLRRRSVEKRSRREA